MYKLEKCEKLFFFLRVQITFNVLFAVFLFLVSRVVLIVIVVVGFFGPRTRTWTRTAAAPVVPRQLLTYSAHN